MSGTLKIKQQKNVKRFLNEEFDKKEAERIYTSQCELLKNYRNSINTKSKNQLNTMVQTILPRIALYKSLLSDDKYSNNAYEITRKYMVNYVGKSKHDMTARLEKFPGFYKIYSNIFIKIMKNTDLQKSSTEVGKDYYNITITDCFWHNACKQYECPELCRAFCGVDDITYGNLKKIGFSRSQTLGMGGTCCDFHFYKK